MSVLDHAKTWAVRQIERSLAATRGNFPHYTEGGEWVTTDDGSWTGGLWVGQLWVAYKWTGDNKYLDAAMGLLPRLEARIHKHDANFDLGFLLYPSFVAGYDLLGEDWLRAVALRGAQRMLDFCHEKTGLIHCIYPGRSAPYDRSVGSTIIDVMMNLSLFWWAGQETGNYKLHDIAQRHAQRSEMLHIRQDGSTFHLVDFDLDTGDILHRGTIHGFSHGSTWARGQAWGIHGFALAHQATGKDEFASTAEKLADHLFERLPPDGKSFWDLSDPMIPNAIRDTSASAISATAWLRMEKEWPGAGRRCLENLAARSLTVGDAHGILGGSTAYKKQGRGIHQASVWGDYYFLQGLVELINDERSRLGPEVGRVPMSD